MDEMNWKIIRSHYIDLKITLSVEMKCTCDVICNMYLLHRYITNSIPNNNNTVTLEDYLFIIIYLIFFNLYFKEVDALVIGPSS